MKFIIPIAAYSVVQAGSLAEETVQRRLANQNEMVTHEIPKLSKLKITVLREQ